MGRRARQISLRECYDILRLEKGADLQAVKHAYRQRAFELHPDLHPGDPDASRQFQLLNEAYVALSAMLKPAEEAKKNREREAGGEQDSGREEKEEKKEEKASADADKAQQAYAEQDVLRDLLNDPFARRVFEDIYSELNQRQEQSQAVPPPPSSPPPPKPEPQRPKETKPDAKKQQARVVPLWNSGKDKGFTGFLKGWARRQIDDEQTLRLPDANLAPGRKVRLQIRRGLSDDVNTVEVTLPSDFQVGKPIRLRGLGKRVGPWQGDLYLTIHTR